MYSKFWDSLSPQKLLQVCADVALIILYAWFQFQYATQALKEQQIPDGVVKVVKMLGSAPRDWPSCVQLARIKFEKYFNHKVLASTIIKYVYLLTYTIYLFIVGFKSDSHISCRHKNEGWL